MLTIPPLSMWTNNPTLPKNVSKIFHPFGAVFTAAAGLESTRVFSTSYLYFVKN